MVTEFKKTLTFMCISIFLRYFNLKTANYVINVCAKQKQPDPDVCVFN